MTNHVKQLRAFGDACGGLERRGLNAAADRIEALERENAALREALMALVDEFDACNDALEENNPGMDVRLPDSEQIARAKQLLSQCGGFMPGADPRYCLHCGIKIECHAGPIPANHDEHMEGSGNG